MLDDVRAIHRLEPAVAAMKAVLLAEADETQIYRAENATSLTHWARRELHMGARETKQYLRAHDAGRDLPEAGSAFGRGDLRLEHMKVLAFGLDRFRAVIHAEDLDRTWIEGMAKADVNIHAVPDGRHLSCGAAMTPILVERGTENPVVLDVGRTQRYATPKQRHAAWVQQGGGCANTGCANTIDVLHHEVP